MKNVHNVLIICLILIGLVCSGCTSPAMRQQEDNKSLALQSFNAYEEQNWTVFTELQASDFIYHSPDSEQPETREELVQSNRELYSSFPDARITIEDIIAEGDKVAVRLTWQGTNKGDIKELNLPATGKVVKVPVIIIFRIDEGKIAEGWEIYDTMSAMYQLGALPSD